MQRLLGFLFLGLLWLVPPVAAQRLAGDASDTVGIVRVTGTCQTCQPSSFTATCAKCAPTATKVEWQGPLLTLKPGENVIIVTAHTQDGRLNTDTLTVRYTPGATTGPAPLLRLVDCTTMMGEAKVRCIVVWESAYQIGTPWQLEQCHDVPGGCTWQPYQTFEASVRQATLPDVPRQQGYCWRVRATGGSVSNTICR